MKTYKQLLEERSALNAAKQQIFHLDKNANLSEINKKINKLSEEIRELEFHNIMHETICDEMSKSKVPAKITFEEFKALNEQQLIKNINTTLNEIDTIPIGVYACLRSVVEKSKDYILRHNYNVYCDYINNHTGQSNE